MRLSIRSRRLAGFAVFVALAIVILNLTLWLLYRKAYGVLEAELARQLENDAALLAQTLDPALAERAYREFRRHGAAPDSLFPAPACDSLRAWRRQIDDNTAFAGVVVFVPDGSDYVDLVAAVSLQEVPQTPHDPIAIEAALSGGSAHSDLYRSGSEYFMEGYAPLRDAVGTSIAAVAASADVRYFGALRRLRNSLLGIGAASVLLLAALGLLFARIEASLARADAAVQRAENLAAMGRLAAGIAHEIRNPLGIIKATASRLQKLYADPQRPDEKFEYIAAEVDRLNAILGGYLSFAKDEPPSLEELDLVPVLQRTLRLMGPELEAPGIGLEVDAPASCPIRGDPQRLQQVIMNVVLNSVQAMPGGGLLRVRLAADGGAVVLSCTDTGPGVPPALRQRLFEPFFTTKEKGSGLGLAVARRIVEQHGGTMTLGAAAGGGARVDIRLPGG